MCAVSEAYFMAFLVYETIYNILYLYGNFRLYF